MSDIIAIEVKIDDSVNNIEVTLHEDPSNHQPIIKDVVSVGCYVEGDFHVSVRLV